MANWRKRFKKLEKWVESIQEFVDECLLPGEDEFKESAGNAVNLGAPVSSPDTRGDSEAEGDPLSDDQYGVYHRCATSLFSTAHPMSGGATPDVEFSVSTFKAAYENQKSQPPEQGVAVTNVHTVSDEDWSVLEYIRIHSLDFIDNLCGDRNCSAYASALEVLQKYAGTSVGE